MVYKCVKFFFKRFTQSLRYTWWGVDNWWNGRVKGDVKLSLETTNALEAVWVLLEEFCFCIRVTLWLLVLSRSCSEVVMP